VWGATGARPIDSARKCLKYWYHSHVGLSDGTAVDLGLISSGGSRAARRPLSLDGWIEIGCLTLVVAALAVSLPGSYSLITHSDPAYWYHFGRTFFESFSSTKLAYGFPLLVALAVEIAGPVNAFLVNVPILLVLVALFYGFARRHVAAAEPAGALWGGVGGAIAVLLLLHLDLPLLRQLTSPYRDPLAHVFVLVACLLLIRGVGSRARGWAGLSGVALGLAVSARETSVLMLLPFLVFAAAATLRDGHSRFLHATVPLAIGFALGCAPLLLQNALVSGNPFVPGQAAQTYEQTGSITPGVRLSFFRSTFPEVAAHVRDHYGGAAGALVGVGLLVGLARRQRIVLFLSLPALLLYLLFYGSYTRAVPRYLFVLDLFALPIAGAGVAALLARATGRLLQGRECVASRALLVVLCAWAAVAAFRDPPELEDRLLLADARDLRAAIADAVPPGSIVLGEYPLILGVRAFADLDREVWIWPPRKPPDRQVREGRMRRLREAVGAREVFFVSLGPKGPRRRLMRFLAREFVLRRVFREPGKTPADPSIHVHRLEGQRRH